MNRVELAGSELAAAIDKGRALIYAIRDGKLALARQRLASVPLWVQEEETGWTALHFAAWIEDEDLVSRLLEAGAVWNLSKEFLIVLRLF